jgi:hypothetical protein
MSFSFAPFAWRWKAKKTAAFQGRCGARVTFGKKAKIANKIQGNPENVRLGALLAIV